MGVRFEKKEGTMKGLVMIGYPGVGKSSCAGKENCIDLESSNFWVNGNRGKDWHIAYSQMAMDLANQGYTVFVSSHKEVREYLASMPLLENVGKVVVFCPNLGDKDVWFARLEERWKRTNSPKDGKAFVAVKLFYNSNIDEITHSGLPVYQPDDPNNYDLMDFVHKARKDWCE